MKNEISRNDRYLFRKKDNLAGIFSIQNEKTLQTFASFVNLVLRYASIKFTIVNTYVIMLCYSQIMFHYSDLITFSEWVSNQLSSFQYNNQIHESKMATHNITVLCKYRLLFSLFARKTRNFFRIHPKKSVYNISY